MLRVHKCTWIVHNVQVHEFPGISNLQSRILKILVMLKLVWFRWNLCNVSLFLRILLSNPAIRSLVLPLSRLFCEFPDNCIVYDIFLRKSLKMFCYLSSITHYSVIIQGFSRKLKKKMNFKRLQYYLSATVFDCDAAILWH